MNLHNTAKWLYMDEEVLEVQYNAPNYSFRRQLFEPLRLPPRVKGILDQCKEWGLDFSNVRPFRSTLTEPEVDN